MKLSSHEKENGQVLVILALGVVALLGFAALAIDGGMFYSDRRYDQNAADSSSLAGAGAAGNALQDTQITNAAFDCDLSEVEDAMDAAEAAAMQRAAANGMTIDTDISDGHGVQVTCVDDGDDPTKYLDIHVMITTQTQTSFAHLVFKGDLQNTTEAVTRIEPGFVGPFGDGYAILALSKTCPVNPNCSGGNEGGVLGCGNNSLTVEVGGIFSNACLVKKGNAGDIFADDGSYYVTYLEDPHDKFKDATFDVDTPMLLGVNAPDCGSLEEGITELKKTDKNNDTLEIGPGIYPGGIGMSGSLNYINMHPGLYCLDGDFASNGGSVSVLGSMDEGVTIYLRTGADFEIGGNANINLRAAHVGYETSPAIPGMLIFMQEDYAGQVKLRGNSSSNYRGTVYAKAGEVDLGGSCEITGVLASQVVANTIRVHGNPGMVIRFDSSDIYFDTDPSTLDFLR